MSVTFLAWIWSPDFGQIKEDEALKQYTTFTVGNLGFFKCDRVPFRLCNAPATFQWLIQNCMGELNFIYCLIYLDDLIVFLWTAEEHLHQLHVVFDRLREYNLKLKPLKCNLFWEEINYLAHQVSKEGIWPSDTNVKAIAEYALPQTCTEIRAFLCLVGHYRQFIKGFARIAQPLNEHLAGEGASRKSEWVSLSEEALEAFDALKQACMNSPVLAFSWLYQGFLAGNRCLKGGIGSISFPEAGRWMDSPSSLWQLGAHHTWKELPFYEAGVSGIKMGCYGTFQRISACISPSWWKLIIIP